MGRTKSKHHPKGSVRSRRGSLFLRTIVFSALVTILTLVAFGLRFVLHERETLYAHMQDRAATHATSFHQGAHKAFSDDEFQGVITQALRTLHGAEDVVFIAFTKDDGGSHLLTTEGSRKVKLASYWTPAKSGAVSEGIRYEPFVQREVYHYTHPVVSEGVNGWVHVGLSTEEYQSGLRNLLQIVLDLALPGLLIGFLASFIFANRLIQPLRALREFVSRIASGDLKARVNIRSNDELGLLGDTMNQMAVDLESSQTLVDERTAALHHRIEMEGLVSATCVELTKCDIDLLEDGIGDALAKITAFLDVDYYCVKQRQGERILQGKVHNFRDPSEAMLTFFQDVYWESASWVSDQLQSNGHVVASSLEEIGSVAPDLAARMETLGVQALLGLPLIDGDQVQPWGMITLCSRRPFTFGEKDARILTLLAEIVHNLFQRRESEKERLSLTQSLNQSQKLEAIGKLSGGIAHDFNNMLVPIIGYSDVILDNPEFSFHHRKELMEIRKAAESAASLTKQLLAFSRKQILQKDRINLNDSISHFRNMLRRILGEDVTLVLKLEQNPWGIEADGGQLEQVLMNLCVNARHAMPGGGNIEVITENVLLESPSADEPSGAFVRLQVKDHGCGMSRELLDHIFEPFYTTKGQDGTGLGLSVVLGIIDQHGGWIHVESEVGKGTSFFVYLPSDQKSWVVKEDIAKSKSRAETRGCERILLIEDEPSVLAFVTQALKKAGYQVISADCAKAAYEVYDEHDGQFDLIFSDAVLPDGTGMEILGCFLDRDPKLRALLSSGYTDARALLDKALERDIPFLHKPYSLAELYEKLREAIHSPVPTAEAAQERARK